MATPVEATAPPSARNLEAAGAADVTFEFRGTDITIPLAIEAWPLDDIRAMKFGRAVRILLGGQRPPMRVRNDVAELSHRMADACGVTPLPEVPADARTWFGAVPTLLNAVDNHGDDLEADLRRLYGIDYRDPAACTLRQVWVMIRRLPIESATMVARNGGEVPWSRTDIISARQWEMWMRKGYPGRPPTKAEIDEILAKRADAQHTLDVAKERESYYASGQNMRDAGIDTAGMRFGIPGHERPPQNHQPQPDDQVGRALAVARKNAARTPRSRSNGRTPEQPQPGFRNGRWDPAGSAW